MATFITDDSLGILLYRIEEGQSDFGPYDVRVGLGELAGSYQDFKVFATEVVFVDKTEYNIGDGLSSGRFYYEGDTISSWLIDSEEGVMRGNGAGEFNQLGSTSTVDLVSTFPKGYTNIWCMKYKITAQQYVEFLNCLPRIQQDNRVKADLSGLLASNKYVMTDTPTPVSRNPIACNPVIGTGSIEFYVDLDETNPPNSSNDGANIALNYMSVQDVLAYLDWSALRPMSQMEYEKICRGDEVPSVGKEYAWGTDTYNPSGSLTNSGTNNESTSNVGILSGLFQLTPLRAGYSATDSSGRVESGATYWGIMDIHNLGELMFGIESIKLSLNSYGDGNLSVLGDSNQSDWIDSAQLLTSQNPNSPALNPISQRKTQISSLERSASLGGRGVRRLYFYSY